MFVYVESSAPMTRNVVNPNSLPEISKRLLLLRKALDYTPDMMASLAGVTRNAWYNYEAGIRRIALDRVFQLEVATGAPQEWIYRGAIGRMPAELLQKIELAKREIERDRRKSS